MTHTWEDDPLDAFLSDAILGSRTSIPQPERRVGEGRGVQPTATLAALVDRDFAGAVFLHAALAELEQVGLNLHVLEANPRVLKLTTVDGGKLDVLGDRSDLAYCDPDDPGTVFLQAGERSLGVVTTMGRCGVVIDREAQGLTQVYLPLDPEPFEPIVSPASRWTARDPWLQQQVLEVVQQADPVCHVRAAGMAKRLVDLSSQATELAAKVLCGASVDVLAVPHTWFRALAPSQIRSVERLACQRASALTARLAAVASGEGKSMDVGLLHERDDLEGIRVLLCDARAGQRLEARLREVDQLGLRLATSGRLALPGDERLRRVHALDSLAWWAVPRSDAS